jgi:hypothetical protein
MTDITSSKDTRLPEWQLLARIEVIDLPGEGQSLRDQVAEAIGKLHVKSSQLEQITAAILLTANRVLGNPESRGKYGVLLVLIWSARKCIEGAGWGYFIIEKQDTVSGLAANEIAYVLEVFLYQERHLQSA